DNDKNSVKYDNDSDYNISNNDCNDNDSSYNSDDSKVVSSRSD
ncbi:4712_t:CDS:1, partial [Funneliformis caledonium]